MHIVSTPRHFATACLPVKMSECQGRQYKLPQCNETSFGYTCRTGALALDTLPIPHLPHASRQQQFIAPSTAEMG